MEIGWNYESGILRYSIWKTLTLFIWLIQQSNEMLDPSHDDLNHKESEYFAINCEESWSVEWEIEETSEQYGNISNVFEY